MENLTITESGVTLEPVEEAALVEAARNDPEAFAQLYQRYVIRIYRYLYHRVSAPADAEDLTAQTFTEALEGLVYYREQGNFSAWLFTIARRKAIAYYRGQRHDLPLEEARDDREDQDNPLDTVEYQEMLFRMSQLLEALDEEQQEMLRLRFSAGLTHKEIGALVGRSEAAVKMAIQRLLWQLQSNWEVRS
jgi:RNA polymerase sigma-70 factor (ECF subfamily)